MQGRSKLSKRLGLAPSSSRIMLKNKIIEGEMKCGVHSKKRVKIKLGANEGLEKILLECFHHMCCDVCQCKHIGFHSNKNVIARQCKQAVIDFHSSKVIDYQLLSLFRAANCERTSCWSRLL
jgi:hypothetical protein